MSVVVRSWFSSAYENEGMSGDRLCLQLQGTSASVFGLRSLRGSTEGFSLFSVTSSSFSSLATAGSLACAVRGRKDGATTPEPDELK